MTTENSNCAAGRISGKCHVKDTFDLFLSFSKDFLAGGRRPVTKLCLVNRIPLTDPEYEVIASDNFSLLIRHQLVIMYAAVIRLKFRGRPKSLILFRSVFMLIF